MPSSMIFVGLVVMWLLILVPAVARHRQEVARPSVTALSGRVLERTPRRDPDSDREPQAGRNLEVDVRHDLEQAPAVATRTEPEGRSRLPAPRGATSTDTRGRDLDNLDGWTVRDLDGGPESDSDAAPDRRAPEREPARYRPGRGGYDPQAAAMAARARYALRQRVVLVLLILAVGSAVAAVFTVPQLWWAHGAVDLLLVGYLVYLRRQVRVEEAIRRRRTARIGAPRPAPDIENDPLPATARDRGADRPRRSAEAPPSRRPVDRDHAADGATGVETGDEESEGDADEESGGTPPDPASRTSSMAATAPEPIDAAPALPRLQPIPTPPVPIGTTLVEGEEDDPALHELESVTRPDYRRASGQ